MESSSETAKIFVSHDVNEAYAGLTNFEWHLMVSQLENFKTLKMEDVDPENPDCAVCLEPLGASDDGGTVQEPIQLDTCHHVFGHICIFRWLVDYMPSKRWWDWDSKSAYYPHESEEAFRIADEDELQEAILHTNVDDVGIAYQEDGQLRPDWRDYLNWKSDRCGDLMTSTPRFVDVVHNATCPLCRGTLSMIRSRLDGVRIEAHLHFWDRMYEKLGITRSEGEEEARNDMLRYVQMAQTPRTEIKPEYMRPYTLQAQVSAMRFGLRRGNRDLDPLQRHLRDAIFNIGCYGLHQGDYDSSSYENRRVPLWCYQVDRIERGLSPVVMSWKLSSRDIPPLYFVDLFHYSRNFYRELSQLRSGPWRRTLFAEVGDRPRIRDI